MKESEASSASKNMATHDRSRSRTPPSRPTFRQRAFAAVVGFVAGPRTRQILEDINEALRYVDDPDQAGKVICEKLVALGGLPLKTGQITGTRKDVVPSVAMQRHFEQLLSNCPKRERSEIELQMEKLKGKGYDLIFGVVMKAGTIGEVTRVKSPDGTEYALKTTNPRRKTEYEQDFELFESRFLAVAKAAVMKFPSTSPNIVAARASAEFICNTLTDPQFKKNILGEFYLGEEAKNLNDAKAAWEGRLIGRVSMSVPEAHAVSDDGDAMLMQFIEGTNVSDWVKSIANSDGNTIPPSAALQADMIQMLVTFYMSNLLERMRLHRDLHPGNIMVRNCDGTSMQLAIVDMGGEVRPEKSDIPIMRRLLKQIHCSDNLDAEACKKMWEELGVTSRSSSGITLEEAEWLTNNFNIIKGMRGLEITEQTEKTKFLVLPARVLLWQTATSTFVLSLQTLGRLPDSESVNAAKIVKDVVAEFCSKD